MDGIFSLFQKLETIGGGRDNEYIGVILQKNTKQYSGYGKYGSEQIKRRIRFRDKLLVERDQSYNMI